MSSSDVTPEAVSTPTFGRVSIKELFYMSGSRSTLFSCDVKVLENRTTGS